MNLIDNVKVIQIYGSSAAFAGSTGDAGGSTAGSTSFANSQSTAGGYPYASTGVDTQGYRGVLFIGNVAGTTAATLYAGFSTVGSSAAVTGWTQLPLAGVGSATTAISTAYTAYVLDVVNPPRFVAAITQVPSSSQIVESVTAILYEPHLAPAVQPTLLTYNSARGSTSAS